jgi:pilus assembly protein CpaC
VSHKLSSFIFATTLAGLALVSSSAQSDKSTALHIQPSQVKVTPGGIGQTLHVKVGESLFFNAEEPLSRVYVDNPTILQSYAASPKQMVISGLLPGMATVVMFDQHGANTSYSIVVDVNVVRLQEAFENQFPMDKILVSSDENSIILKGYVASQDEFAAAGKLSAGFGKNIVNSLRIAPSHLRQVRLEMKFVEVDRTKLNEFAFNFISLAKNVAMTSTGQAASFSVSTVATGGSTSATVSSPLNLLLYNQGLNIGAALQDMAQKQVLEVLAEPNIVALSGHTGSFLAGGEFPFPTVQGATGGAGTVSLTFKPYGVALTFLPVVLDDGTIRLHVAPEVSALDYTNEVQINGYAVPALSSRKAETDIELRDGQTFALSGLLDHRITDQLQNMPGFASIPIIGKLL